jgi:hypothetical protein
MIEVANYKRAIAWLERNMTEQARNPKDAMLRDGLTHSFEVTYNVTESTLRQALSEITGDASVTLLSSRDLMRYAADEGLAVCSAEAWLRYGIALEEVNETLGDSAPEKLLPLLPRYIEELHAFAIRLEERLVSVA